MEEDGDIKITCDGGVSDVAMEEVKEEIRDGELSDQLQQLQDMVREMKDGFSSAMQALSQIQQGDQILQEKVENNKVEYDQQIVGVVEMVVSLKKEFTNVTQQLQQANEIQKNMQQRIECLQFERDILLEELEKQGSISTECKQKYHSGQNRPHSSDPHNNSISTLLERNRGSYHNQSTHSDHDSGVNTGHNGDMSSCGEVTPPQVSPLVQSYIAGLEPENIGMDPTPMDENYDSDSSLTVAANKSLDLSRSLGDKCNDIANVESSDEEGDKENKTDKKKEEDDPPPYASTSPIKKVIETPKKIAPHERNAKELQRSRIAREVMETERKYCSALWTILDHFASQLKQAAISNMKDINVMFPPCLARIYEHHCFFLQSLEERLTNWKWQCILGDIFARFIGVNEGDLLKLYQSYVNQFPEALNQIKRSCKYSHRFRKFLKKQQRDPCCEGLDVGAFLLTPIQRIPRYVLLMKQLLKYTDCEHPDFYHIDSSLQKLGSFLNTLNDSIEYSMQNVSVVTTPNLKRRLIGSFRSRTGSFRSRFSANSDNTDTYNLSSATRDSGIQSQNGDSTMYTSTPSNQRMVQMTMMRDRRLMPAPPLDMPVPPPPPAFTPTHYAVQSSMQHYANQSRVPVSYIQHGAAYTTQTLPLPRGERKRRQKRPKSGDMSYKVDNPTQNFYDTSGIGVTEAGFYQQIPNQTQPDTLRPYSVYEQHTSDESYRSQNSGSNIEKMSHYSSHESLHRSNTDTDSLGGKIKQIASQADTSIELSFGSTGKTEMAPQNSMQNNMAKSLPRIPRDYGILGQDQDSELDESLNGSMYKPSMPYESNTRRAQKLGMNHRSKSQADILQIKGSDSPSQLQINMSLARSLTGEDLNTSGDSGKMVSFASDGPKESKKSRQRPKSAVVKHVTLPDDFVQSRQVKENVWDNPADGSLLEISTSTLNRKELKKKKKDKQKKMAESLNQDGATNKKGASIKDSIKSLFFKKRGSKIIELGPAINSEESFIQSINQPETTDLSTAVTPSPTREQAPPLDLVVSGESEGEGVMKFNSFEDENGDPCSAV